MSEFIPAARPLWAVIEDYSGARHTYGPAPVVGWDGGGVVLADDGCRIEHYACHNGKDRRVRVHYRDTRAEADAVQRGIVEAWMDEPTAGGTA